MLTTYTYHALMLSLVSRSSKVRSSGFLVDQGLARKTGTAHTFTSHSELVASQLWVLATLTMKPLEAHLQVLFLLHLLSQLRLDREPTEAQS
jgi:hypothetical protein